MMMKMKSTILVMCKGTHSPSQSAGLPAGIQNEISIYVHACVCVCACVCAVCVCERERVSVCVLCERKRVSECVQACCVRARV